MSSIRDVVKTDIAALKIVVDSSGLFPSELLDDMIAGYFNKTAPQEIWLTQEVNGTPMAIAYCAPEKFTEGTYNLYLIAVHEDVRGQGIGAGLMNHIENLLRESGQRILLVETSGLGEFELTRNFYDKCAYHREAVIREFYTTGEDKVIFWKKL